MSQFRVVPAELRAYAQYLRDASGSFDDIARFIRREAADASGLTGLLAILAPAVALAGGVAGAALGAGRDRLRGSAGGLERSARDYEATDAASAAASGAMLMPDIPAPAGGR